MLIFCERCGKQGTIDDQSYPGKRLRIRCPYCYQEFIYLVPRNGKELGVVPEARGTPEESMPVAVPQPVVQEEVDPMILEAKRIARLIISEIKLYNHDKIEKAGSKREVLDLLRTDLMRGKQHYQSRIAVKLPSGPDYFTETVKEILLAGKY